VRSALSASLQSLATVMFPPFIITRAGKFLRLEDPDQVLADTRSLIEAARQQKANAGDATVQVSTNLQEAVSAESISAQIGLIWNMMVGSWSGTTLTTGKGYGFRIPGSQSADKRVTTVTYSGVSRLVGRVACGPNEPPNGCVALETTIEADPGELKSWLHDRRPTVTAGAGTNGAFVFDIDSATRQTTMRLVAEPDTLLPRRLQWVNRGSTRLQLTPSKLAMDTHQQSEIVMDFQYLHR
jgi:hypothetical protein